MIDVIRFRLARAFVPGLVSGLALLASCSTQSTSDPSVGQARQDVLEALDRHAGAGAGSFVEPPPSLVDALPGSAFNEHRRVGPLTDIVALGTVSDVAAHGGWVLRGGADSPVPFTQDSVDGRYALVTLGVSEELCPRTGHVDHLRFLFTMAPDDDLETIEAGLRSMGELVVFVRHYPNREPGIYDLAYNQGLISEVDADGRLDFAALRGEVHDHWFLGGETVEDLRWSCPSRALD